jgi:nucleotide-binding universal stress UspA family protein
MLIKCPICGAHVPRAVAVETPAGGAREHYCSLRCAAMGESQAAPQAAPAAPAPLPPVPRRLLVAVDGSGPSLRAVELATSLARACGGRITILHAIDPAPLRLLPLDDGFGGATRLGLDVEQIEARMRRDAEMQLQRCARICRDAQVEYACRIEAKPAVRAIAEAADEADLVVVGSRGLGAFSGAALGSLSHRVIGEVSRPVLVVH